MTATRSRIRATASCSSSRSPAAALRCAIEVQRALAEHAAESPEEEIRVRMGLHTGEAIAEEGDFFGRNVVLAARIAAQARGAEILVSEALREQAEGEDGLAFDEGRELELKGMAGHPHRSPRRVGGRGGGGLTRPI